MKLTPYKKILKFSKEKIQESLAPIRALQAKKKAELELLELESSIADNQERIHQICAEHPIDFRKLMNAMDDLAIAERQKKQLEKIIAELFDTDSED